MGCCTSQPVIDAPEGATSNRSLRNASPRSGKAGRSRHRSSTPTAAASKDGETGVDVSALRAILGTSDGAAAARGRRRSSAAQRPRVVTAGRWGSAGSDEPLTASIFAPVVPAPPAARPPALPSPPLDAPLVPTRPGSTAAASASELSGNPLTRPLTAAESLPFRASFETRSSSRTSAVDAPQTSFDESDASGNGHTDAHRLGRRTRSTSGGGVNGGVREVFSSMEARAKRSERSHSNSGRQTVATASHSTLRLRSADAVWPSSSNDGLPSSPCVPCSPPLRSPAGPSPQHSGSLYTTPTYGFASFGAVAQAAPTPAPAPARSAIPACTDGADMLVLSRSFSTNDEPSLRCNAFGETQRCAGVDQPCSPPSVQALHLLGSSGCARSDRSSAGSMALEAQDPAAVFSTTAGDAGGAVQNGSASMELDAPVVPRWTGLSPM